MVFTLTRSWASMECPFRLRISISETLSYRREILTHWEVRHFKKWVCPQQAVMRRSTDPRMLVVKSHFPYKIIISIRRQTLPSWRQLLPRQPARWLYATNFIDRGPFCYIFRQSDRWLRSTATDFIDPGPLNYTSANPCIPPRLSTLDAGFPSMVNDAPTTVEISHPVTGPSWLVELSSCSLHWWSRLLARCLSIEFTTVAT